MCSTSPKNKDHNEKRKVNGRTEMEIQEWNIKLRSNNICMDEHISDVRMKKIEDLEKSEAQKRQDRDKSNEERERKNIEKVNEDREWTNNLREVANDQRECKNKDREKANGEREWTNEDKETSNNEREWKNNHLSDMFS
jgi:hypothetical protein